MNPNREKAFAAMRERSERREQRSTPALKEQIRYWSGVAGRLQAENARLKKTLERIRKALA